MELLKGSMLAVMPVFAFTQFVAIAHASPPGTSLDRAAVVSAPDGVTISVESSAKENSISSLLALRDVRLRDELRSADARHGGSE